MILPDYYEILGLPQSATRIDIKTSFRQLAKKYHPDSSKSPETAEIFIRVSEAYQILSDPHKRSEYDKLLQAQDSFSTRDADGSFNDSRNRHEQWASDARRRAKKHSKMSFSAFAKLILGEVGFALQFTGHGLILLWGLIAIPMLLFRALPKAVSDSTAPDGMVPFLIFGCLLMGFFMWVILEKIKEGYKGRDGE